MTIQLIKPINNVHIINAHQRWQDIAEGKLNQHFVNTMTEVLKENNLTYSITLIEDGYDIDYEVSRMLECDLIIMQFPMYWMSLPWLGKKYIDEVFMHGYSKIYRSDGRDIENGLYGSGGLLNNHYMLSITANAPEESFTDPKQFFNGLGSDGAFSAVHNSFRFVGCKQLPTFIANNVIKNLQLTQDTERLRTAMHAIINQSKSM